MEEDGCGAFLFGLGLVIAWVTVCLLVLDGKL